MKTVEETQRIEGIVGSLNSAFIAAGMLLRMEYNAEAETVSVLAADSKLFPEPRRLVISVYMDSVDAAMRDILKGLMQNMKGATTPLFTVDSLLPDTDLCSIREDFDCWLDAWVRNHVYIPEKAEGGASKYTEAEALISYYINDRIADSRCTTLQDIQKAVDGVYADKNTSSNDL